MGQPGMCRLGLTSLEEPLVVSNAVLYNSSIASKLAP